MASPRPLRVGVVGSSSYSEEAIGCFKDLPKNPCSMPGFEVEIFDSVMRLLNWDYNFVFADSFGSRLSDGNWTGLLGLAFQNQIDMSAVTVRILEERLNVVDFSYPVWNYKQTYIYRKPGLSQQYEYHNFVFKPFQNSVWYCFLFVLFSAFVVHWLMFSLLGLKGHCIKTKLLYGEQAFWSYAAILLKQDYPHQHRFWSTRQLKMFWTFFAIILGAYYQMLMYSLLARPLQATFPFLNCSQLVDLLERGTWHLTYGDAAVLPECPIAETKRMKTALLFNPVRTDVSYQMYLNFDGYATTYSTQYIDLVPYQVSRYADQFVMVRDDSVSATFGAFVFAKNSTYRHKFDTVLMELLPGMGRIMRRYPRTTPFLSFQSLVKPTRVYLSFEHLSEAFVLFGSGMTLAFIAFFIELYHWPKKLKKELQSKQRKSMLLFLRLHSQLTDNKTE